VVLDVKRKVRSLGVPAPVHPVMTSGGGGVGRAAAGAVRIGTQWAPPLPSPVLNRWSPLDVGVGAVFFPGCGLVACFPKPDLSVLSYWSGLARSCSTGRILRRERRKGPPKGQERRPRVGEDEYRPLTIDPPVFLAPRPGSRDLPFRTGCAPSVAPGPSRNGQRPRSPIGRQNTRYLDTADRDAPGRQLFGSDSETWRAAAAVWTERGPPHRCQYGMHGEEGGEDRLGRGLDARSAKVARFLGAMRQATPCL
jgi:hypothetical protein